MFPGFTEDTIQFFLDIRFHNEVSWMHEHHDEYVQKVQQPFYQLIGELSPVMMKIDPDFELRPAKCLSRIHRDTRYSMDKSPYRDHHWVAFRPAGIDKYGQPFYWFELGPDSLNWGVGIWGENRPAMNALRLKMVHETEALDALMKKLQRKRIIPAGPSNSRMKIPPEIPEELAPLYRLKNVYFEKRDIDWHWAFDDRLVDRVSQDFKAMKPVYLLLKDCVAAAAQQAPDPAAQSAKEDF